MWPTITRSKLQVDFYHLVASPLERVLPQICEKVLGSGGRLLVVAEEALVGSLDQTLWSYAPESFLPHGMAAGENAADQPVLLSSDTEPLNGATNIALADGLWREEALGFARAFLFFDAGQIDGARQTWRTLKGNADVTSRYWKQDDRGRWVEGP